MKNSWKLQVKVTKQEEDGIVFSFGDVYRIKDDNTEERVQQYDFRTYKCDDETMTQKMLRYLEVAQASGEAVGAWTSALPFMGM